MPSLLIIGLLLAVAAGLGLVLFNLHQVSLVFLVTALGERLPLPWVRGLGRATVLAGAFALAALTVALGLLRQTVLWLALAPPQASVLGATGWLLVLPFLVLPCYMFAAELAAGWRDDIANRYSPWMAATAIVLRWLCGLIYVVFVVVAFALSYAAQQPGPGAPWGALLALLDTLAFIAYLLLAPLPVLVLLAALGQVQRAVLRLRRTRSPVRP